MSSVYYPLKDGEPYTLDIDKFYERHSCCDCGLVHDNVFDIMNKSTIKITSFRNNRSTGQLRRQMKNRGEII